MRSQPSFLLGTALLVGSLLSCSACSTSKNNTSDTTTNTTSSTMETPSTDNGYVPPYRGVELDKYCSNPNKHLVIETKQGTIVLQLFDKLAPNHVKNIETLASTKYFDGLYFHRVIPGFMIQGGDPNTRDNDYSNDGTGSGPQRIKAEFSSLHHSRGILSAARTNDPNSASSQFFICVADAAQLDHQYTIYGQVIKGMDAVDKIVNLPTAAGAPPTNPGRAAEIIHAYIEG